jgi:hypothetical protein
VWVSGNRTMMKLKERKPAEAHADRRLTMSKQPPPPPEWFKQGRDLNLVGHKETWMGPRLRRAVNRVRFWRHFRRYR